MSSPQVVHSINITIPTTDRERLKSALDRIVEFVDAAAVLDLYNFDVTVTPDTMSKWTPSTGQYLPAKCLTFKITVSNGDIER